MPNLTLAIGIGLTLLGAAGFAASSATAKTALIPALFGLPLIALAIWARNDQFRRHAMHAAVVLALLGFLGSVRGLLRLPSLFDGSATRPLAVGSQSVMAVLCLTLLIFGVRSFIAARRARLEISLPSQSR